MLREIALGDLGTRWTCREPTWVANAAKHSGPAHWSNVFERWYASIVAADFSGPEALASNRCNRLANKVITVVQS